MKNNIFDTPQREELIGIIIQFGFQLMKNIKSLWIILIPLFLKRRTDYSIFLIIGVILLIILIINVLRYLRLTYFIDTKNNEFVIESGILNRKQLRIHRDKVQDINLNQTILQRIFNVYSLKIDSQGSASDDIQLRAISHATATVIRDYLLNTTELKSNIKKEVNGEENEQSSFSLRISPTNLLKYAITSNYVRSFGLLLAGLFYMIDNIRNFFEKEEISSYFEDAHHIFIENSIIFLTILLFFSVFILIVISNAVLYLYRYYNFQLQQNKEKLTLSYGLVETKNSIISIKKIQYLITKQNWIQRKWSILGFKFHQIGEDIKDSKNSYYIPACSYENKEQLVRFILGKIPFFSNIIHANIRKFVMKVVFFIIIPILLIAILFQEKFYDWFPMIIIYSCVVSLLSYFSYRNSQLKFNDDYLCVKSGMWDITETIIPVEKIQKMRVSRFFWQKRTNLGSVRIFTAGGNIYFSTANYSQLLKLMSRNMRRICGKYRQWL